MSVTVQRNRCNNTAGSWENVATVGTLFQRKRRYGTGTAHCTWHVRWREPLHSSRAPNHFPSMTAPGLKPGRAHLWHTRTRLPGTEGFLRTRRSAFLCAMEQRNLRYTLDSHGRDVLFFLRIIVEYPTQLRDEAPAHTHPVHRSKNPRHTHTRALLNNIGLS